MNNSSKKSKTDKIIITVMFLIIAVLAIILFKDQLFPPVEPITYKIKLVGNKYITLEENEDYVEEGYQAIDSNNKDVTSEVKVENPVNISEPGTYRIVYQIGDYYEYRTVEVKKKVDATLDIVLETDNTKKTNEDVTINVTVIGEAFVSLVLPDGRTINKNKIAYSAKSNGIYRFEAINNKYESYVKEISIKNIDKDAPRGNCSATLTNTNTSVTVKLYEEEDIKYHYYDNDKLVTSIEEKKYTFNYETTNNIYVVLEDDASNKTKIKCSTIENKYHEQIKPGANEKIVYHGDSDTLKAYIVDRGSYYFTYIWVKNAYTQLNKFDSPEYGRNLYKPNSLLTKAMNQNGLQNKIIIGFNASGFYLKDTYDAYSVSKYSAYDRTSVGTLVITNGNVVRNAYAHAVKTWYTIGVDPNNKLLVFEDKASGNSSEKQSWADDVVGSGIRNTFTFAAPLIQNGKRTGITTSMPGGFTDNKGLQIICQVNENNYLLFTSSNQNRNNAMTEFEKLGCQTAMNLDGGGSIALMYKDKNSTEFKTVIGGGRELPEAGYFTE